MSTEAGSTEAPQPPQTLRILSLDGGGVRGLSSLIILREMMRRVQHVTNQPNAPCPCDFFELIVGTGTGGISALLLGRMRLSIDQAIHEYIRMANMVFRSSSLLPQLNPFCPMFDHNALADFLDQTVKDHLGDCDAFIFDPILSNSSQCRTAVLAAINASLEAPPYIFRSYSSSPPFKVTDVARATSATIGMFPSVSLSYPPMRFVDAGTAGYNNPTEIALDEAHDLWPEKAVDLLISIGTGMQPIVDAGQDKLAGLARRLMSSCEVVHERVCRRLPPATYFRFSVPQGLEDIGGTVWAENGLPGRVAEITVAYLGKAEPYHRLASCVESMTAPHIISGVHSAPIPIVEHRVQQMAFDFQLKVKAFGIPNYRSIYTPNCYARITIDGGHIVTTGTISGPSPEWGECFDVSLEASSMITIQVFHTLSPSNEVPQGTASIQVGNPLPREHETIYRELHQANTRYQKGGVIVVTLLRRAKDLGTAIHAHNIDAKTPNSTKSRAYHGAAAKSAAVIAAVTSADLYRIVAGYVGNVIQFRDVLSRVHPYAEAALSMLAATHRALQGQLIHDDKIKTLLIATRGMFESVEKADTISRISELQDTVSSMMVATHECALFIQDYGVRGLGAHLLSDHSSTTSDSRIDHFITTFNHLKLNFDQGINIQTFNSVHQFTPMLEYVHVTEADKLLESLPGWNLNGVKFNESKVCLDGTRQQLLDDIRRWVYSPDGRCILWLSGSAGTGKTCIANSVAVFFDNLGRLGACFCFNRDTAGLNDPSYLFGNLCYQLAHFNECGQFRIKARVLSAIHSTGHVAAFSLQTQARKLIVEPITAAELIQPVVVIIDGLDESGTPQMRKEVLGAIAAEFPKLPRSIRIIITSRDEPDIRASLQDCSRELCIDEAKNTQEDIAAYIRHRLTMIQRHSHLRQDWPGFNKVQKLVSCAGRLFIWASVACNLVEEKRSPTWWLDRLLDTSNMMEGTTESPLKKLDTLYNGILRNAFPDENDPLADFRYVVGSIVCLDAPLSRTGLDSLLGLGDDLEGNCSTVLQDGYEIHLSSSDEITSCLQSILRSDFRGGMGKDGPLRLLHPSLYEFLTSHAAGNFRIDPYKQNRILVNRCLTILNTQLKFDICKIGDPSLLNKEVTCLPAKIERYVSHGLRYSCRSLSFHISKVSDPDIVLKDALKKFVSEHLLHWIETMSLLGEVSKMESVLHALFGWIKNQGIDGANLQALLSDAIQLLRNSGDAVRLSALHTYFSSLPLTPKMTSLFNRFFHNVPRVLNIVSSHSTWPTSSIPVMDDEPCWINHVVFSPDGKKLATATSDGRVRFWDVETAKPFGESIKAHEGWIHHVIFSPDGTKLASASSDETVRLWNIEDRRAPPQVHTDEYSDVGFSPDGQKPASAPIYETVQFGDVKNCRTTREALSGHTAPVVHVAFSPDGKMLASASEDQTVRLWDVESRKAVGKALTSHIGNVNQVAFSPDGQRLVSASDDQTVRLWNMERGRTIGEVLSGHTGEVNYVAFSPNGTTLASVGYDGTVWVWDVDSGQAIREALELRTYLIDRILFSSDGKLLASVGYDGMVRLWDVMSGHAIGEPFEPYADYFHSSGMKLRILDDTDEPWSREEFDTTTKNDSRKRISLELESIHKLVEATVSFDPLGFLRLGTTRLMWLPVVLRGHHIATQSPLLAIGGLSGAITIIRFLHQQHD